MAASRSPERRVPALTPAEGLTAIGAAVVAASVFIPWYGIPFSNGRSVTALDSFGFAHAALLLTVAAAVWLVFRRARGHTLARPLDVGRLVAVAGGWAALLTVFLIFDRPEELAGSVRVGVRLGPFFSLAGSLAILVGGLRMSSEPPRAT